MVMINHNLLRAAQSKAAIALFLMDGNMWLEAVEQMKAAASMPCIGGIHGMDKV
ncbi:TPA: host cell division inhibitory peptide Kil [Klebsiella oxytoca]|nr:host cell division inhibitory peptide Kil [Klebsiella oxytoca]